MNDTDRLVIYPNDAGGITVLHPILESGRTVEEIAATCVPTGTPFRYIIRNDLPKDDDGSYDRSFRSAWEADFSLPDGYGA